MAIEPGWKITAQSAKNLARWDTISLNGLKDTVSKLPELSTNKKLTIIDVGANTGCFTELMLTETPYQFERALLFEPATLYARWAAFKFSCLSKNPAVEVMEYALSDERGIAKLAIDNEGFNFGSNTLEESRYKDLANFMDVVTVPFDEIYQTFQFVSGIDLIKISVEGHEAKVLNGMKGTLNSLNNKPPMIITIEGGIKHHDMEGLQIILNDLKDLDYIFDNFGKWPEETFHLVVTQQSKSTSLSP